MLVFVSPLYILTSVAKLHLLLLFQFLHVTLPLVFLYISTPDLPPSILSDIGIPYVFRLCIGRM